MSLRLLMVLSLFIFSNGHNGQIEPTKSNLSASSLNNISTNISINLDSYLTTTTTSRTCRETASTRNLLFSLFTGIVAIIGTLGNAAVLFVVVKYPNIRRHKRFLCLASLAIADAGVSVFVTLMRSLTYFHNGFFCYGIAACTLFQITDTFFPISSMTHIFVLCIDRWYAIIMPYEYIRKVTTRKMKTVLIYVWVYSVAWMLLGTFKWSTPATFSYEIIAVGIGQYCWNYNRNYVTMLLIVVYFIPIIAISVLSRSVLREAKKLSVPPKSGRNESHSGYKAFKAVMIVITVYIICWLPHCVNVLLSYWWENLLSDFSRSFPRTYDVITSIISNILPTLNSCLNPFIYCFFSREFQIACKDLILRWSGQPRYWSSKYSSPSTNKFCVDGHMIEMTDVHKRLNIETDVDQS